LCTLEGDASCSAGAASIRGLRGGLATLGLVLTCRPGWHVICVASALCKHTLTAEGVVGCSSGVVQPSGGFTAGCCAAGCGDGASRCSVTRVTALAWRSRQARSSCAEAAPGAERRP